MIEVQREKRRVLYVRVFTVAFDLNRHPGHEVVFDSTVTLVYTFFADALRWTLSSCARALFDHLREKLDDKTPINTWVGFGDAVELVSVEDDGRRHQRRWQRRRGRRCRWGVGHGHVFGLLPTDLSFGLFRECQ